MTDRYATYERLKFDTPADRILRITMDAPVSYTHLTLPTKA